MSKYKDYQQKVDERAKAQAWQQAEQKYLKQIKDKNVKGGR